MMNIHLAEAVPPVQQGMSYTGDTIFLITQDSCVYSIEEPGVMDFQTDNVAHGNEWIFMIIQREQSIVSKSV